MSASRVQDSAAARSIFLSVDEPIWEDIEAVPPVAVGLYVQKLSREAMALKPKPEQPAEKPKAKPKRGGKKGGNGAVSDSFLSVRLLYI